MCGRYLLREYKPDLFEATQDFTDIRTEIGTGKSLDYLTRPRFNIAPTQLAPVVIGAEDCGRVANMMRWGLVPGWAKDLSFGAKCINARAETAWEKPSFRTAMRRRRAIVPCDGYYEWRVQDGRKQPFVIYRPGGETMGLAGVWEEWTDRATGEIVRSYAILTVESGGFVRQIHDRMPVILEPEDYGMWLDPNAQREGELDRMIRARGDDVTARAVSARVGNVRNDDASLAEPDAAAGSL